MILQQVRLTVRRSLKRRERGSCDCGLTLEVAVRGEERITSITLEIGKYRDFYHQEPRRSVLLGTEPLDSPEGVSADILTRQYRSFGQEGTYICA
jgi:hypothetical protein